MHDENFCKCCWFNTISFDTYEICDICWWEDDPVQNKNPLSSIWANHISLFDAQSKLFKKIPQDIFTYQSYHREKKWKPLVKSQLLPNKIKNWMDYFKDS